jgi:hypothetical protein
MNSNRIPSFFSNLSDDAYDRDNYIDLSFDPDEVRKILDSHSINDLNFNKEQAFPQINNNDPSQNVVNDGATKISSSDNSTSKSKLPKRIFVTKPSTINLETKSIKLSLKLSDARLDNYINQYFRLKIDDTTNRKWKNDCFNKKILTHFYSYIKNHFIRPNLKSKLSIKKFNLNQKNFIIKCDIDFIKSKLNKSLFQIYTEEKIFTERNLDICIKKGKMKQFLEIMEMKYIDIYADYLKSKSYLADF